MCPRFLQRASLARKLSVNAELASTLNAELDKSAATVYAALVWELAAQAALFILSCAAIVFACLYAAIRLRWLNRILKQSLIPMMMDSDPGTPMKAVGSDSVSEGTGDTAFKFRIYVE